ncbi:MAG: class I SAM-dependent methyltransferase [Methanobacteriaceae archaeon]
MDSKDDYPQKLLEKIKVNSNDTVLDIGCGNGVITVPLAKKAKSVTAMDISPKMLDLLNKNAAKEGLTNISFINQRIEDINPKKDIKPHDVVVASRSLNGVYDIKKELSKLNDIAKKYVYITLWGITSRNFENEASKLIGREFNQHPDYIYAYNILHELGIYANIEMLECNNHSYYSSIDEAMDRLGWRIGSLNKEEDAILREYLTQKLVKTENSMLKFPHDKPDWVLIWWKKK